MSSLGCTVPSVALTRYFLQARWPTSHNVSSSLPVPTFGCLLAVGAPPGRALTQVTTSGSELGHSPMAPSQAHRANILMPLNHVGRIMDLGRWGRPTVYGVGSPYFRTQQMNRFVFLPSRFGANADCVEPGPKTASQSLAANE